MLFFINNNSAVLIKLLEVVRPSVWLLNMVDGQDPKVLETSSGFRQARAASDLLQSIGVSMTAQIRFYVWLSEEERRMPLAL